MSTEDKKVITFDELKAHSDRDDLYILIHGKVYAASKFLDEHPGGDEVILAEAGKDATEAFEDVGHSDEARDVLNGLYIGEFDGADSNVVKKAQGTKPISIGASPSTGSPITYLIPLSLVGAFLAWRFVFAP
ncbi:hypothetical protein FRC04_000324 [Tulasnella sp. 424]|nr:hypothetical protein FRC04_000324 [Tulasnella sp. 424]KAG8982185.1 hypothetical protein FRC05_000327 [Tulasnella sp. 425]